MKTEPMTLERYDNLPSVGMMHPTLWDQIRASLEQREELKERVTQLEAVARNALAAFEYLSVRAAMPGDREEFAERARLTRLALLKAEGNTTR